MLRSVKKKISNNLHFLVGILIGLYVSALISTPQCQRNDVSVLSRTALGGEKPAVVVEEPPTRNFSRKLATAKKTKPIRPRYYSTELGIREKLFVGILTSEEKIGSQAIHLNATIGHVVEKVKFFITVQNKMKSKFNLSGIVGFTDTRHKYKPFQIIKYIGDSFLLDYDYYFLINDYSYINIRALKDIVSRISVSMNVYLGTSVPESSFCNLDAGIVISNSVLKAMRDDLEWCVSNAVSDDHSENFGRCVYHSTNLDCQESIQGQTLASFKLKHFELGKHLEGLSRNERFAKAVTVFPVLQPKDFYLLNTFFSQRRLTELKQETLKISKEFNDSWPPGQRVGNKPTTRFDMPRQIYFNATHTFFPDDFTNLRKHTKADQQDIKTILGAIKAHVTHKYPSRYHYHKLLNGYRKFDLSRGMDYQVDVALTDQNGEETVKRFEICKPLGKVELVPVPYVTENSRVTLILPVEEHEKEAAFDFLNRYAKSVVEMKDKSFLMLVLLYQFDSASKGTSDVFNNLKNTALKMLNKKTNEEAKVAWVSVKLPKIERKVTLLEFPVLNYAVIDLALRKVGLDSLNLVLDVHCDVSVEFLNRVRMNTIVNVQVFSPIPFRQYNPKITQISKFEVNKNIGHFDREEFRFLSFYSRDYVNVRKRSQRVPIIKSDNDIVRILDSKYKDEGNIFEMFVEFGGDLHNMRATEPNLKVKYHEEKDPRRENLFLGNKGQLATLILSKKGDISEI